MLVGAGARMSAGAMTYSAAVGGHGQEPSDRVADGEVGDAVAERLDRARDVNTGGVRQRHGERTLEVAAADPTVDGVERRRSDPDARLAGTGGRLLYVLVAEDVGFAVFVETNCLHFEPRFRLRQRCFKFESSMFTVALLQI
jgi:hypothetical protein